MTLAEKARRRIAGDLSRRRDSQVEAVDLALQGSWRLRGETRPPNTRINSPIRADSLTWEER